MRARVYVWCDVLVACCYPDHYWEPRGLQRLPVRSLTPDDLPSNQSVLDAVAQLIYSEPATPERPLLALGLIAFCKSGQPGPSFFAAASAVLDKNAELYRRLARGDTE